MEKVITIILCSFLLTGCTGLVKPSCGEKPVYKRYDISMPVRPELQSGNLTNQSTEGQVARAYENDLINLTEYALKLENLLAPIAVEEGSYNLEPTEELPKEDNPWYRFW